ncbi:MAG: Gfo/Idh/MocA family oxidoreductase, partial [Planctomycetota bacterium]|nr:Gfo/Idh/MocA family oxidoreductase [Planctomycetota bacterium]
ADCHLVAYRNAGFNPVAIASRSRAKAAEAAARHKLPTVHDSVEALLDDERIEVLDIGVPPHKQFEVVQAAVRRKHLKGILCQKPLGVNYAQAAEIVRLCRESGKTLAVNQNMRYDQSVRGAKDLLGRELLGAPVLATVEMRAIPHWMPWQTEQGWCTLRIMSIHHLDTFRYWFGDPERIYCSTRPDPRTKFAHTDGICLYVLEYANGLRASSWDDVWAGPAKEGCEPDIGIRWRIEGTQGMARGTIGWPKYPERCPSTLDYTCARFPGRWHQPRWNEVWFPDAFVGPMAELLRALETGREPETLSGADNLKTMALVDAAYASAEQHRAVAPEEMALT